MRGNVAPADACKTSNTWTLGKSLDRTNGNEDPLDCRIFLNTSTTKEWNLEASRAGVYWESRVGLVDVAEVIAIHKAEVDERRQLIYESRDCASRGIRQVGKLGGVTG